MKPFTEANKNGLDEDLRRNWRNDGKCRRKKKDRPHKKRTRQALKRRLTKKQF